MISWVSPVVGRRDWPMVEGITSFGKMEHFGLFRQGRINLESGIRVSSTFHMSTQLQEQVPVFRHGWNGTGFVLKTSTEGGLTPKKEKHIYIYSTCTELYIQTLSRSFQHIS